MSKRFYFFLHLALIITLFACSGRQKEATVIGNLQNGSVDDVDPVVTVTVTPTPSVTATTTPVSIYIPVSIQAQRLNPTQVIRSGDNVSYQIIASNGSGCYKFSVTGPGLIINDYQACATAGAAKTFTAYLSLTFTCNNSNNVPCTYPGFSVMASDNLNPTMVGNSASQTLPSLMIYPPVPTVVNNPILNISLSNYSITVGVPVYLYINATGLVNNLTINGISVPLYLIGQPILLSNYINLVVGSCPSIVIIATNTLGGTTTYSIPSNYCSVIAVVPPPEQTPPRSALYREFCSDRPAWFTTKYTNEFNCQDNGGMGYIYTGPGPGYSIPADAAPLYRCQIGVENFDSRDANCELAYRPHSGIYGYIVTWHKPGTIPLYRCYNPNVVGKGGRHMTSISSTCENGAGSPSNGFHNEGALGYVFTGGN